MVRTKILKQNYIVLIVQPGLGSRSRVFLAPWSRSRSRLKKTRSRSRLEKSQEPEPLKKLAGSLALREYKKHKEIVL